MSGIESTNAKQSRLFQHWDWGLFFLILLYATLPSIYKSYQLFLIGNELPTAQGLAIASQWQFVQIIFEVVQEATVLPLFFFLGSKIKQKEAVLARLKTAFSTIFLIGLFFSLSMLLFLPQFITSTGALPEIRSLTADYVQLKIVSSFLMLLSMGLLVVLESLNKKRLLLLVTLAKVILMLALDSLFIGGYSFSLNWGIMGAAWSGLLVEGLLFLFGFGNLLYHLNLPISFWFSPPHLSHFQTLRNIGAGIGLESLIKNLAYWLLILKLINEMGPHEISAYYLCMHIFWSFALVPVLAVGDCLRALIGNYTQQLTVVKQLMWAALLLVGSMLLGWGFLWIFQESILSFFNADPTLLSQAKQALNFLFIPYMLLAINMTLDSLFYGLGKTQYLAYQAILTNGTVYLGAYICYIVGIWIPDFSSVMLLFGLGILVDSLLTVYFVRRVLKNKPSP